MDLYYNHNNQYVLEIFKFSFEVFNHIQELQEIKRIYDETLKHFQLFPQNLLINNIYIYFYELLLHSLFQEVGILINLRII